VVDTSSTLNGGDESGETADVCGFGVAEQGKQTRRERFLAEMDAIIPWAQLLELIEPHYPKAGNGRPPLGPENSGTIVDATIIAAPSSTKNATETRDPEMKQARKGKNWHFGMKVHVGTDRRGVVHSLTATHAATADITEMNALLHGQERTIFGDQAYWKEADRQRFRAAGVRYRVNRRGTAQRPLTEHQKKINQSRSAPERAASTRSGSSSNCAASRRYATAGSRRTPPAHSHHSRLRTSI